MLRLALKISCVIVLVGILVPTIIAAPFVVAGYVAQQSQARTSVPSSRDYAACLKSEWLAVTKSGAYDADSWEDGNDEAASFAIGACVASRSANASEIEQEFIAVTNTSDPFH